MAEVIGDAWRQYMEEQRGEDVRLAYMALTRAQHQAVVWWAGSWESRNSPLGRLLSSTPAGVSPRPLPQGTAEPRWRASGQCGCCVLTGAAPTASLPGRVTWSAGSRRRSTATAPVGVGTWDGRCW